MQGIRLVTFDATNTILKFKLPPWQCYTIVARRYGFIGTDDDVKHRLIDSYNAMWHKYPNFGKSKIDWESWWKHVVQLTFKGHVPEPANIEVIATELIQEFTTSKCWCKADDSDKLLQRLRDEGVVLVGVISNFDPRLEKILQSVKFSDSIDFVVTSYETGFSKPDKRIFNHALKQCGHNMKPNECLHIGDNIEKDYEGAKAAGWHALVVSDSVKVEKPPAPDHVFNNLNELYCAIKNRKLKL